MDVHLSIGGRGDIAARIYRQLLDAIPDGRLRPDERLPSRRHLAVRVDVSRNTVAGAYERLTAEGFPDRSRRLGHVRVRGGGRPGTDAQGAARGRPAPAPPAALRAGRAIGRRRVTYHFRVGTPDVRLLPLDAWRQLVGRELGWAEAAGAEYGEPAGHASLRAAIARHVGI